ncbi:MAG: hypothetical protein LIP09_11110 [Bacteroidales bacterium]|nr:hypothetical protein [Bacteroidales bacterium]
MAAMTMKQWSFRILLAIIMTAISSQAWAQADEVEIFQVEKDTIVARTRYDKRLDRYQRFWNALIPRNFKFQMYGGMGLVNIGVGWRYGKNHQWETDLLFGLIPKYESHSTKVTMTLKENFTPWKVHLKGNLYFQPLSTGLYFNTVFSDQFWTHEPSRYPRGYYGFSTRVRTHVFVGERLKLYIPESKRHNFRSISVFYEISSCDLYIVSAATNSYLKPKDYLVLSLGLICEIF